MPPDNITDAVYEGNVFDTSTELSSWLDFLPMEDLDSSECTSYISSNNDEECDNSKDFTALNGDDKFLDSILKGLLDNEEKISSSPENTFFEIDDLNLFESSNFENSAISVLGVDLNLSSYNNGPDINFGNILNDSGELDLQLSEKVNEMFTNTTFDYNFIIDDAQQDSSTEIFSMFPHMNDEKNRRRRNLLYESTCSQYSKDQKYRHEYKTKRKDPLLNHDYTQKKAEDEKFFTCPILNCEKVYAKASHLKAHLRRHSGEKPFVCNWQNCTWRFSRSDELARHKRSHSGIKPYKCELCEKAFARSDHLSKHKKVHKKKMAQCGSYFIKKRTRYN